MNRLCSTFCALMIATPICAHAGSPKLAVGYYVDNYYVQNTHVDGAGQCFDTQGYYYTRTIYYPGPLKTGEKQWRPILATNVLYNEVLTMPVTPAAGVGNWAGTYSYAFLPNGATGTVSFNSVGTITDDFSGVATSTSTYTDPDGGTCTEITQESISYTGK